jgi:uncharacterized protein YkwD
MRKLIAKAMVLVLMLGIAMPTGLFASEIGVTIDDMPVVFEGQGPVIIEGRTLVPLRGVFEQLGFEVDWDQNMWEATLTNEDFQIKVVIASLTFTTNGIAYPLEQSAQIIDGRTLLPIRAVLESVGYFVDWDQTASTVIITSPTPTPSPTEFSASEFELRIFELTNIERANHGIAPLIWSDELAAAARAHSIDMAVNNNLNHTGADGTGFRDRMDNLGFTNMEIAENISGGSRTPEAMTEVWMNSPGHRGNILNAGLTHLGVGFHHLPGSQWEFYATQKFVNAQ